MSEPIVEPRTAAPPALKEWALVCDLLLEGRMALLLRKGGINEKGFWVEASEFFLFPTYFHQNRDKVRPEWVAAFDDALAHAPPDGVVRLPGACRVADAIEVRRPERIGELEDLHPYTRAQVEKRLEFRPRKPLVLLAVETVAFPEPVDLDAREEFAGCVSWVPVGAGALREGRRALSADAVDAIAERARATVG